MRRSLLARALVLYVSVAAFAAAISAASSATAAETCPNAEYRVGPSAHLPDCRAYEQVTPQDKESGAFYAHLMGVGADGTPDLLIEAFSALPDARDNYGIPGGWYTSVRTADGWSTVSDPPPASEYQTSLVAGGLAPFLAASLDGRSTLWYERSSSQPDNRVDFYVTRPDGKIEDVGPLTPPGTPSGEVNKTVNIGGLDVDPAGVSADLSHILYVSRPGFASGYDFWPFDTSNKTEPNASLYEFVGVENKQPLLVGVDDSGALISRCGTEPGGESEHENDISEDGRTVFFTSQACTPTPTVNELYARLDNGEPDARTVAISEPLSVDCGTCNTSAEVRSAAHFEGASTDGSKVFFTTFQPLQGGDGSRNIYEYDFDAPAGQRVIRVSGGDASAPNPIASVKGVVRTSQDGSHVYFVAGGILTTEPNAHGQVAVAGANNLYLFERDAQFPNGRTVFIAGLSDADSALWGNDATREADVTPDGDHLVFASTTEHLTPDDTSTGRQLFEYDAGAGSLIRVSVGQDGYNDNGNTSFEGGGSASMIAAPDYSEQGFEPAEYWGHMTMSADGDYVFFQSTVGLTPLAFNHVLISRPGSAAQYAKNIYEYHDGSVYLISDGRDVGTRMTLVGTNASGDDVLFTSLDQLAPQDDDTDVDVYDARIDGGFPAPVIPPECSGDGCQGPLSPAPTLLAPGSEFQAGAGNVAAAPASAPAASGKAKPKAKKSKAQAKRKKKVKRKRRKATVSARHQTVRGAAAARIEGGGRS